jgi:protein-tyrosine phosphatase
MPSVLFVCTANRFRSPLSAAFFQSALKDFPPAGEWDVDSAGTWTVPGLPVLPDVAMVARKYGLDLARHRSKPVTGALLSAHDLILVMESGHKESLQIEFPLNNNRIYLLSHIVEERSYDIPDLFDSLESILEISGNIYELIRMGYEKICNQAIRLQGIR